MARVRYARTVCPLCGKELSVAGVAQFNHNMKHYREGLLVRWYEPFFDEWRFARTAAGQERVAERMREGALQVYWIPNPPRAMFCYPVRSIAEAQLLLHVLAAYDLYLGEDLIGGNAGGLQVFENGEWLDWIDEEGRYVEEVEAENG